MSYSLSANFDIDYALTAVVDTFTEDYIARVQATSASNLIAYWPMNETSGTTADNAEGTAARDGTYSGVTVNSAAGPFSVYNAPLWDGSNDHLDIYSASLNSAFSGAEGTIMIWFKVSGAGVWTGGVSMRYARLYVDANNEVSLIKLSTNNTIRVDYKAGGTLERIDNTYSATTWTHLALTWSAANDEAKVYVNGSQGGSTSTGLGTWAGNLDSANTVIGASNTIPQSVFDGYLAHCAIWTTPLAAATISDLATI